MYQDASKLFDALRQKAASQATGTPGFFGNQNILKMKPDTSYKFRLLWIPPSDGYEREYPMINQYVHRIWDENAVGSKNVEVFCKTSQYDEGETKAGWACPVCRKMGDLYKKFQEGSQSAKELYDKFRRSFKGYVPVYVIQGPEEDMHKVKILQYTKTFKDFFDLHIFGIINTKNQNSQNSVDESEIYGIEAFTYYEPKENAVITNAYDLIVTAGSKNVTIGKKVIVMPDYKMSFSRKKSEIDFNGEEITVEKYLNLSNELNFDKDLLRKSTNEELEKFVRTYIDASSENHEIVDDEVEIEEEIEIKKPAIPKKVEKVIPAPQEDDEIDENVGTPSTDDEVDENVEEASTDSEDINIEDLLKDI